MHLQNSAYGKTPSLATQHIGFTQLTKSVSAKKQNLLFGVAPRYTYSDDNTVVTQTDDSLNPINAPSKTFLLGVFMQDEIKFSKKNSPLAGIRYDYNSHHGHVVSPRFNWKWNINKSNVLLAGVGNGYRVVNLFSEDHSAFSGARKVIIPENLKPEQSWNGTMNLSSFIQLKKGFINLESSVFYTYFTNKIVADYFVNSDQIIFQNLIGYGVTSGAGFMAQCSFGFPLKLIIGATYIDVHLFTEYEVGNLEKTEQVHSPPFTGNFVISYRFNKIRLNVDVTGNIYSSMLLPVLPNDYRPSHSPWFGIVNFQLMKEIGAGWQIYSGVKNLFNFVSKEDPIMRPFDSFDKAVNDPVNNLNRYTFDPGYNYAPIQGARFFMGVRYILK